MENVIKLNSRERIKNYLERLFTTNFNDGKAYLLITPYNYRIIGNDFNFPESVDPAGGPMITVGDKIEGIDTKVKKITVVEGLGTVITFE